MKFNRMQDAVEGIKDVGCMLPIVKVNVGCKVHLPLSLFVRDISCDVASIMPPFIMVSVDCKTSPHLPPLQVGKKFLKLFLAKLNNKYKNLVIFTKINKE